MAWYNQAFRGSTGRVIRGAVASARPVAASVASAAIAGNIADATAQNIVQGLGSASGAAYNAGASIGQAIVSGLVAPLGETGQAIAQVTQQLTRALGDMLSGLTRLLGGVAGAAARIFGTGVGLAGGIGGALIGGALGGAGGATVGAAIGGLAATALMKIGESVGQIFGGVLGAIGKSIGVLGQTATTIFTSLAQAVQDLARAAQAFGRQVQSIRSYTGLGYGAAGDVAQRFNLFGLQPPRLDPAISGLMGGMFGLPSFANPNFLPAFASKYQSLMSGGLMGRSMASMMAGMTGMGDPDALRVAMTSPGKIREQIGFQQDFANSLGMTPQSIRRIAEDLPLAQARVASAIDLIKLKLYSIADPLILKGLGNVATFLADHAKDIVEGFKTGLRWLYSDLPPLMIGAGRIMVAAAHGIIGGLGDMGHSFAQFLRLLDIGRAGFADWIGGFLQFVDNFSTGFKVFMQGLGFVSQVVYDFVSVLSQIGTAITNLVLFIPREIGKALGSAGAAILDRLGLHDLAAGARYAIQNPNYMRMSNLDQVTGLSRRSPFDAIKAFGDLPETNLYDKWSRLRASGTGGKWADQIDQMVDGGSGQANSLLDKVSGKLDQFEKATSGNGTQFDNLMRQQVDLSRQMVDKLGQPVELQGGFDWNNYNKFMADADARLVRNVHRAASRAAG